MKAEKTRTVLDMINTISVNNVYTGVKCTKEDALNEITELERLAELGKAVEKASEMNPYRVIGNHETYSDYNQGWQACIDYIESIASEKISE